MVGVLLEQLLEPCQRAFPHSGSPAACPALGGMVMVPAAQSAATAKRRNSPLSAVVSRKQTPRPTIVGGALCSFMLRNKQKSRQRGVRGAPQVGDTNDCMRFKVLVNAAASQHGPIISRHVIESPPRKSLPVDPQSGLGSVATFHPIVFVTAVLLQAP